MKRILYSFIACLSFIYLGCQKEVSFKLPVTPVEDLVAVTVQGNVVDENGDPAQGVSITAGNKTAVTDARGYFRIKNASLDKSASLVTADKPGYYKALRVFTAGKGVSQVSIKLLKKSLTATVNAATGGVVSLSNGSTVTFTANSFSRATGGAYTGTVNVYAKYIDPTDQDISETVPGSFLADDKDNRRVLLASYGMMAVELESAAGEKLQLTAGNTATLNFTIPASLQASAPTKIALWYVDEKTGLWKEEGSAVKTGNRYTGGVKHFTYWNCDVPGPTVTLTAKLINPQGQPLIYADVNIRPASGYGGSAHGYTDSLGQINGPVPANTNLIFEVMAPNPCYNIIYSQNIGPYSANVNLGTITVNSSQSMLTVQGKLVNCNSNPVTNGFAIIVYNNNVRYVPINSTGDFFTTIITCGSTLAACMITGVDSLAQQQGQPVTINTTSPITNAGNITACGTSTVEFINYTLDGNSVNLSSTTLGDNFYGIDSTGQSNHIVFIQGYRSQAQNISFDFASNGAAGTFPVTYLSTESYNNVTPIQPFNAVVTNYPQTGGFFEGSFSGQFKDALNNTHTLTGTFRTKRR